MLDLTKNVKESGPISTKEDLQRAYAVAAALEVIATLAGSGSSVNLESEMKSLSSYADLIQEALKAK